MKLGVVLVALSLYGIYIPIFLYEVKEVNNYKKNNSKVETKDIFVCDKPIVMKIISLAYLEKRKKKKTVQQMNTFTGSFVPCPKSTTTRDTWKYVVRFVINLAYGVCNNVTSC